jgi:hypothetical protein
MTTFRDREGKPIDGRQWGELFSDENYRQLAHERVSDKLWISTIWWGIEGQLYETAVSRDDSRTWRELLRYDTEEKARQGHAHFLELARRGMLDEDT